MPGKKKKHLRSTHAARRTAQMLPTPTPPSSPDLRIGVPEFNTSVRTPLTLCSAARLPKPQAATARPQGPLADLSQPRFRKCVYSIRVLKVRGPTLAAIQLHALGGMLPASPNTDRVLSLPEPLGAWVAERLRAGAGASGTYGESSHTVRVIHEPAHGVRARWRAWRQLWRGRRSNSRLGATKATCASIHHRPFEEFSQRARERDEGYGAHAGAACLNAASPQPRRSWRGPRREDRDSLGSAATGASSHEDRRAEARERTRAWPRLDVTESQTYLTRTADERDVADAPQQYGVREYSFSSKHWRHVLRSFTSLLPKSSNSAYFA